MMRMSRTRGQILLIVLTAALLTVLAVLVVLALVAGAVIVEKALCRRPAPLVPAGGPASRTNTSVNVFDA
jgi:hypothetical protein